MSEERRGCGYRQVGGLYLVGTGLFRPCDALPLALKPCTCCGFVPSRTRGFQWISTFYIDHLVNGEHTDHNAHPCNCPRGCPICYPPASTKYGFMWAGEKYYTPESFVDEAQRMGVSKRIAEIPKGLKLGETWVMLAHPKVKFYGKTRADLGALKPEAIVKKAIFYAFRPQRVEKIVWEDEAEHGDNKLAEENGVTLVKIPRTHENVQKHGRIE